MPTLSYAKSLRAIAERNPDFVPELLEDAANAILNGEMDDGRVFLKDCVNATIGFAELGRRLGRDPKNLMRSLRPDGNPTASNLMAILRACADAQSMAIAVSVTEQPRMPVEGPLPL